MDPLERLIKSLVGGGALVIGITGLIGLGLAVSGFPSWYNLTEMSNLTLILRYAGLTVVVLIGAFLLIQVVRGWPRKTRREPNGNACS